MALSTKSSVASQKATRGFLGSRVSAPKNVSKVVMRAGNWLPGSEAPSWLPEDLPGNFGFDPCGLAKDPDSLKRFTEGELINGRWAMLGAAGALAVELFGFGSWADAPLWAVKGGSPTYFGVPLPFDLTTLLVIEFVAIAFVELKRAEETDPIKKLYPGGAFDPLGFSKDPKNLETLKLKEIKNGRLAMVACVGFFAQNVATGKGPIAALGDHLASPWSSNFATNGVSLPFF